MAMERSANCSDEVTEGQIRDGAEEERVEREGSDGRESCSLSKIHCLGLSSERKGIITSLPFSNYCTG